jgi:hypothetical protein
MIVLKRREEHGLMAADGSHPVDISEAFVEEIMT